MFGHWMKWLPRVWLCTRGGVSVWITFVSPTEFEEGEG